MTKISHVHLFTDNRLSWFSSQFIGLSTNTRVNKNHRIVRWNRSEMMLKCSFSSIIYIYEMSTTYNNSFLRPVIVHKQVLSLSNVYLKHRSQVVELVTTDDVVFPLDTDSTRTFCLRSFNYHSLCKWEKRLSPGICDSLTMLDYHIAAKQSIFIGTLRQTHSFERIIQYFARNHAVVDFAFNFILLFRNVRYDCSGYDTSFLFLQYIHYYKLLLISEFIRNGNQRSSIHFPNKTIINILKMCF